MGLKSEITRKQKKLDRLKKEVSELEEIINNLKIVSRQRCPVNLVCQCAADKNWDGVCKMSS